AAAEAVHGGSVGLVITRRAPGEVREDYDLATTPVLWLTSTLGQNHMPPMPPGQLERAVRDFVAAAPKAVIALEGIEYLATYVDVPRIVRCLHTLRDLATAGGGVLMVSADLGAVAGTGTAPPEIRAEMRIFLDRAERRYGPDMARWSGDPEAFPGLQAMTSRLFL